MNKNIKKSKKVVQNCLPKVIFGVIDQVGFGHIFLDNQGPCFGDLTPFVNHGNPRAPGQSWWFDYPLGPTAPFFPDFFQ
jgi:hypothetical protein